MPVLNRPGSILRRSGMFGFSHPDPSYGFRGTAFKSYNPRNALVPPSGAQGEAEQPLPSPLPPSAVPSPGGTNGALMPTFANPIVANNSANDANAYATYLENIQAGKSIPESLRAQSIARARGKANNLTGNMYLGRELATDANRRSNDLNAATVRGMDAYSGTMLPSLAREADSRATLNTGENDRANKLLPYSQDSMNANTWGKYIENAGNYSTLPMLPQMAGEQVRTAKLRNERDAKMLPVDVRNAERFGKEMEGINAERERLLEDQRRFLSTRTPAVSSGVFNADPLDDLERRYDLLDKANLKDAAKEMLRQSLLPGIPPSQDAGPNLSSAIGSFLLPAMNWASPTMTMTSLLPTAPKQTPPSPAVPLPAPIPAALKQTYKAKNGTPVTLAQIRSTAQRYNKTEQQVIQDLGLQ